MAFIYYAVISRQSAPTVKFFLSVMFVIIFLSSFDAYLFMLIYLCLALFEYPDEFIETILPYFNRFISKYTSVTNLCKNVCQIFTNLSAEL